MNRMISPSKKAPAITKPSYPESDKTSSQIKKIVQISRWLSLDVALGAMLSSAMVCRLMNMEPIPWMQLLILGGVVLLIYTLDHLWDVHHMSVIPITARHSFHWRFQKELWRFAAILFCILCIGSVLILPLKVIYFGLTLGCVVAAYLWLVNRLPVYKINQWFHKELCIAIIYTAGIWGSVWIQAGFVKAVLWLLAILFGIIALLNLLLFSCYELEEDIVQTQRSIVITWGKSRVITGCILLFVLFSAIAVFLSFNTLQVMERRILYIECIMAGILLLLFSFPDSFKKGQNYRWIGDGIFFLPALSLF